jgi:hypothetical protein
MYVMHSPPFKIKTETHFVCFSTPRQLQNIIISIGAFISKREVCLCVTDFLVRLFIRASASSGKNQASSSYA